MRKFLKYLFHNVFCHLMLKCRMDLLLRSLSKNKRLVIMYHGVRKGDDRINGRHITASHFEKQLQYFKRNFDVVTLEELCEMKTQGITPARNTIALTFDDGFLNNLIVELPLLERYGIPATFFICTAGIQDENYAHPTDSIDLLRVSAKTPSIQIGDESFNRRSHKTVTNNGMHAYHYVINELPLPKWLTMNDNLFSQLDQNAVTQYREVFQLMNDQHVRVLANNKLVNIGSHAHHHVNLRTLSSEEVRVQLLTSKNLLEAYSRPVNALAFPYGYFSDEIIDLAKKTGYRYLIAGGHVDPPYDKDVFPRIGVLDGAGFSYSMLMISKSFGRFGF